MSRIPARAAGPSRRQSSRPSRPRCCPLRSTPASARVRTTPSPKRSCPPCASSSAGIKSPRAEAKRIRMDIRTDWPPARSARAIQAPPCAMVIFGSSGDLTKRLLIPALYNLAKAGRLSDKFALIGVDRTDRSHEEFRAYLAEGVRSFVSDTATGPVTAPFDARAWEFLAARMTHLKGDVTDPDMYSRLAEALKEADREHGTAGNVVFYLAVAASLFGPVVERLAEAGLTAEPDQSWRRVIIEKPFGHDLDSARALDARLAKVLSEHQIYRMDYFLGKETVQNILVLRFANGIFEPMWNRDHIDHVQITVAETVGVERRAGFYEETGALRDLVEEAADRHRLGERRRAQPELQPRVGLDPLELQQVLARREQRRLRHEPDH